MFVLYEFRGRIFRLNTQTGQTWVLGYSNGDDFVAIPDRVVAVPPPA